MELKEQNTAFLVMDMQAVMLSMFPAAAPVIKNVAKAIAVARSKKIPVIYVTIGFRPGAPEANTKAKLMSSMGGRERWTAEFTDEWMKIHPDVAPLADEIIVVKRRFSAFTGSDLEVILRAQDIQRMILTGVSTSGVVLSTLREAADKDYSLTVLSDCCADRDEEVHRVLVTKIFPRHAEVITVEEWGKIEEWNKI
jgi:nicotinamidase-related amidase